jgi:hypothetical protein
VFLSLKFFPETLNSPKEQMCSLAKLLDGVATVSLLEQQKRRSVFKDALIAMPAGQAGQHSSRSRSGAA